MKHDSETLNAKEGAAFLNVHVETLRRLARRGEIPSFKVGKDWRFNKEALLRWTQEQKPRAEAATVLIVDDDIQVCRVLSLMIQRAGYQASFATTGLDGLELVAHETPDLILLDLKMRDMSGPEFLEKLRKIHPDLPVVIVTGYPDGDLMHQALLFGPLIVIAKPVDSAQLERTVRMAMHEKTGRRSGASLPGKDGER